MVMPWLDPAKRIADAKADYVGELIDIDELEARLDDALRREDLHWGSD